MRFLTLTQADVYRITQDLIKQTLSNIDMSEEEKLLVETTVRTEIQQRCFTSSDGNILFAVPPPDEFFEVPDTANVFHFDREIWQPTPDEICARLAYLDEWQRPYRTGEGIIHGWGIAAYGDGSTNQDDDRDLSIHVFHSLIDAAVDNGFTQAAPLIRCFAEGRIATKDGKMLDLICTAVKLIGWARVTFLEDIAMQQCDEDGDALTPPPLRLA